MELELEALAAGLNLPAPTVARWIRQGRLPVRQKGDRCIFSRPALQKWAAVNHLTFVLKAPENAVEAAASPENLFRAVKRGGVFYEVEGDDIAAVLRSAVSRIAHFETAAQKQRLLDGLMARESLMSTGVGRGIAIPHPRTPLECSGTDPLIAVCFLKNPLDYKALDREPVFVLFVLVCPSPRIHLRMLSRLSYCLRDAAFVDFLCRIPDKSAFLEQIRDIDLRLEALESDK